MSQILCPKPRPVTRAFTLIEILVFIAIIAILAAILFPVFGRARNNARRAQCQSNLKQFGLAIVQYTQDYDEYYPRTLSSMSTNPPPPGDIWFTSAWAWQQILYPYHKSIQIFVCPNGDTAYKAKPFQYHYGANDIIMPTTEGVPNVKESAIRSVSKTFLLFDSGMYRNSSVTYARAVPASVVGTTTSDNQYMPGNGDASGTTCTSTSVWARQDCQSGRHFGGINMAYADGHVKWLPATAVYAETTKPANAAAGQPVAGGQWRPENS